MIFDNLGMYFDDAAHNATSSEVDLSNTGPGKGEPITIWIQGHSLTTGGTISFDLQTATSSGGSFGSNHLMAGLTAAEANGGVEITVPVPADRYSKLVVSGTTGGTISAGIICGQGQTNV